MNNTPNDKLNTSADKHDLIVFASAGCGKTTKMVETILQLLTNGVCINNILVVTFTNFAAAEMKQRISDRLTSISCDNPNITNQLSLLDNCNISTLHAFCSYVLRNYFYIVNINPNFEILDDDLAKTLKSRALTSILEERYQQGDNAVCQLNQLLANHNDNALKKLVMQFFDFSSSLGDVDGWFEKAISKYDDDYFEKLLNKLMTTKFLAYRNSVEQLCYKLKSANANSLLEHLADIQSQINLKHTNSLELNLQLIADWDIKNITKKSIKKDAEKIVISPDEFNELTIQITQLIKKLTGRVKEYLEMFDCDLPTTTKYTKLTKQYLIVIKQLSDDLTKAYAQLKSEQGLLDYNDLEHLTLAVLQDNSANQALKSRFKHIFVDEYQDINHIQETIINLLKAPDNTFFVGDVKQSIYGFRNSNPQIFIDRLNNYRNSDGQSKVESLSFNYRSDAKILAFVNNLFTQLMTVDFSQIDYSQEALSPSPFNADTPCPVCIDLVSGFNTPSTDDEDAPQDKYSSYYYEGIDIVNRIKEVVGTTTAKGKTIKYGDIAILLRKCKDNAFDIYQQLVNNHIPVVYEMSKCEDLPYECRSLTQFAQLIYNRHDDVLLVGVLTGGLINMTSQQLATIKLLDKPTFYQCCVSYAQTFNDQTAAKLNLLFNLLEEYTVASYTLSVDKLFERLIKQTNLELTIAGLNNGSVRLRRLNCFIESLINKPYSVSLIKFVSYLDTSNLTLSNDNLQGQQAVRLLTMHKSKGLEWEVVFVANLKISFFREKDSLLISHNDGLATMFYDNTNYTKYNTLSFEAIKQQNRLDDINEELRLLYVAVTRAKSKLFLVATQDAQLPCLPPIQEANSLFDFVNVFLHNCKNSAKLCEGVSINNILVSSDVSPVVCKKAIAYQQPTQDQVDIAKKQLDYIYPFASEVYSKRKIVSSQLDYIETETPYFTIQLADAAMYGASVGTAYHKALETIDFTHNTAQQVRAHIDNLVANNILDSQVASKLQCSKIVACLCNADFTSLVDGGTLMREAPFILKTDYGLVMNGTSNNTPTVLQGIVDLIVIKGDTASVIDFKFVKSSALLDQRYKRQINSYKLAVSTILKIPRVDTYIFSIDDNQIIKIENN